MPIYRLGFETASWQEAAQPPVSLALLAQPLLRNKIRTRFRLLVRVLRVQGSKLGALRRAHREAAQ